mgnify:FL=1
MRDFGDGFQPGPPPTCHPVSAPVAAFRSLTVKFRVVLPFCSRLPLRRLSPAPIIGHPPRLLRLHARNVAPRSTVCIPLTSSLADLHASISDPRVGPPLQCPLCSSISCSARGSPLSPARLDPLHPPGCRPCSSQRVALHSPRPSVCNSWCLHQLWPSSPHRHRPSPRSYDATAAELPSGPPEPM